MWISLIPIGCATYLLTLCPTGGRGYLAISKAHKSGIDIRRTAPRTDQRVPVEYVPRKAGTHVSHNQVDVFNIESPKVVPRSQAKYDGCGGENRTKYDDKVPHGMITILKVKVGCSALWGRDCGAVKICQVVRRHIGWAEGLCSSGEENSACDRRWSSLSSCMSTDGTRQASQPPLSKIRGQSHPRGRFGILLGCMHNVHHGSNCSKWLGTSARSDGMEQNPYSRDYMQWPLVHS